MMKTWTRNRRGWGLVPCAELTNKWSEDGAWHNEPDKAQWIDKATDLDCLAVRHGVGYWCGYVGVPPGHPLHGTPWGEATRTLDVHGGVNYSDGCDEEAPEGYGICHIPEPGRPANVWWFGFACCRFGDLAPLLFTLVEPSPYPEHLVYRPLTYVRKEIARLAAQLAAFTP